MPADKTTIIAIDGPSGTGKSTTAKLVAKELGYTYLDTGAMYRAVAYLIENGELELAAPPSAKETHTDETQKTKGRGIEEIDISFDSNNNVLINGINREKEIRSQAISAVVSRYSADARVRAFLTTQQRKVGEKQNCVLDGRDIGTAVFPNAKFKFFLTADYKIRAERRLTELKAALGDNETAPTLESVEQNLRERDELDSKRAIAPLTKAKDAIEIDTTHLTITQQVQKVLQSVGAVARCTDLLATTHRAL